MQGIDVRKIGEGQKKTAKVFSGTHFLTSECMKWQLTGTVVVKLRLGLQKTSRSFFTWSHVKHEGGSLLLWGCVASDTGNILWVEGRIDSINSNKFWMLIYKHKQSFKNKLNLIWGWLLQLDRDPKVTSKFRMDNLMPLYAGPSVCVCVSAVYLSNTNGWMLEEKSADLWYLRLTGLEWLTGWAELIRNAVPLTSTALMRLTAALISCRRLKHCSSSRLFPLLCPSPPSSPSDRAAQ